MELHVELDALEHGVLTVRGFPNVALVLDFELVGETERTDAIDFIEDVRILNDDYRDILSQNPLAGHFLLSKSSLSSEEEVPYCNAPGQCASWSAGEIRPQRL